MFCDNINFANRKLAPNSSSEVKVIEKAPYSGVNVTGPLLRYINIYSPPPKKKQPKLCTLRIRITF